MIRKQCSDAGIGVALSLIEETGPFSPTKGGDPMLRTNFLSKNFSHAYARAIRPSRDHKRARAYEKKICSRQLSR